MVQRVWNFSSGPAVLPEAVLRRAQEDLLAIPGIGISVLEISHRSDWCQEMIQATEANLRKLLHIPVEYHVMFLQGGASLQFSMVPLNLLRGRASAGEYLVTGSWGQKAVAEARREGTARAIWDGKPNGYSRVPRDDEFVISNDAGYLHFTSNETIQGVQFGREPSAGRTPLICDQSSDFLWRPIDVTRYGLIYAGAQKNAGPAGATIVLLRDDLLQRCNPDLPVMLSYRTYVESKSCHNTPPVFAIYIVNLVTQWLLDDIGGLTRMEAINRQKAAVLYDAIDRSGGFYRPHAEASSRSLMNATWRLPNDSLETEFLDQAKRERLFELKGHRSVGGIRASIYNAMPLAGVQKLAQFMDDFRARYG